MSPTEVMIEWSKGCLHIEPGEHPSKCLRCTNSALQAILRPMVEAAQAFRSAYTLQRQRRSRSAMQTEILKAGVLIDDYLQKQVVGKLKPRPKESR